MKKYVIIIILVFFSLLGCAKLKTKNGVIYSFNTIINISLYHQDQDLLNTVYQEITDTIYYYHKLSDSFNSYQNLNNIYTINNNEESFTVINDDLKKMLESALELKTLTSSYFNPFIGNLTNLYKLFLNDEITLNKLEENIPLFLLQEDDILIIDEDKVRLPQGLKIDLGAFSKGYVLEMIKNILKENNITYYLIDLGSSSVSLGLKPKSDYFNVGLKYVDNKTFKMKNKDIGTSSIYEQSKVVDNKVYHHIINPFTGYNSSFYDSIYLFGDNSIFLDAFVTAFMSMDLENIKTIAGDYNFDILIYKDDNIVYQSFSSETYA